nr:thermonuclease family protein [Nitrospirota bacterium]
MIRFHGLAALVLLAGIALPDGIAAGSQAHRNDTKPQPPASTGQKAHRPSGAATVRLPPIYSRQALRHLARKPFAQEHLLPRRAPVIRMPLRMPAAPPMTLNAWKIRVIDGDTFAYGADRIRLRSIDTPEKDQSGGFEATQRLDALLHEGTVTMVTDALDLYGRTLADVYVDGRNVAEVLRSEGYAKPRVR